MQKNLKWKILLIAAIIGLSLWSLYPPFSIKDKDNNVTKEGRINLGLDLQGGMHLVLKVDTSQLSEKDAKSAPDIALEIIRNRVDQLGVKEVAIQKQGTDEIVVQLPGVTDRDRAVEIIGQTALLEFKLVSADPEKLKRALDGDIPKGYELKEDEDGKAILLEKHAELTGAYLTDASVDVNQSSFGQYMVKISFNKEGAKKFAKLTRDNVGRRLAIVLDNVVKSAPTIRDEIPSGEGQIEGNFSPEEAADLSIWLRAGALPAPVYIEEERTVGPLLGRDSVNAGIKAILTGFVLVVIFMLLYYMLSGVIATIALLFNIIIIGGVMGYFNFTLTLPGIAGLILTIGMAVDANVLIYERIREEITAGKTIRSAISIGYSKAFSAILDSNITTLIAAIMLFQFGTGPIRGFAMTLSIGIASSLFTALVVTRSIFNLLGLSKKFAKLHMLKLIGNTKINFVSKRKICYVVSVLVLLVGLTVFAGKGEKNFGVDFTGGTLQQFKFQKPVDISHVRGSLERIDLASASIQQFSNGQEVLIRTYSDTYDKVKKALTEDFDDNRPEMMRIEKVGPSVGKLLQKNATKALLLGILGILIYIGFRFKHWEYGLAGVIALFHDVLITIGAMAITGREFDLTIVAALLTIAGYSINDTVVIYDRIRENTRTLRKVKFMELINISINQTLSRTVLTTLTTLFTAFALFFLGGKVLHNFAFCLIVGFMSGIYSTIFIASPLLIMFQKKRR